MSKTGAIYINFSAPQKVNFDSIFNLLVTNKWSVNKYGQILYMVNGTFDFESAPISDLEKIINEVKISISNGLETVIDFIWEDNETIIGLLFTNDSYIIVTVSENIKKTDDGKNMDFPFYLEKLKPLISNQIFSDVECVYNE